MTGSEPTLRETIDVERLAAIMAARMPDGCYLMRDDGSKFDIINPTTAAAMLAHLYETGDVLSGLAALPPAAPDVDAVEACLAELAESPLPGARYAYNVVARRLRVETTP